MQPAIGKSFCSDAAIAVAVSDLLFLCTVAVAFIAIFGGQDGTQAICFAYRANMPLQGDTTSMWHFVECDVANIL